MTFSSLWRLSDARVRVPHRDGPLARILEVSTTTLRTRRGYMSQLQHTAYRFRRAVSVSASVCLCVCLSRSVSVSDCLSLTRLIFPGSSKGQSRTPLTSRHVTSPLSVPLITNKNSCRKRVVELQKSVRVGTGTRMGMGMGMCVCAWGGVTPALSLVRCPSPLSYLP